jgi:hypothetical protein
MLNDETIEMIVNHVRGGAAAPPDDEVDDELNDEEADMAELARAFGATPQRRTTSG